ncbi:MAG: hypothetical protein D4S01_09490 [Dehalococcoidia bacterium]|nr:MAG: hypothetical protein D4S01_09490 [Dehalococcoidia bacterium]
MGMMMSSCSGAPTNPEAVAPNPSRFTIQKYVKFHNAYVLRVHYHDCTNYEGIKVMVYDGQYQERNELDPHFNTCSTSPLARFKPTHRGWAFALAFAKAL